MFGVRVFCLFSLGNLLVSRRDRRNLLGNVSIRSCFCPLRRSCNVHLFPVLISSVRRHSQGLSPISKWDHGRLLIVLRIFGSVVLPSLAGVVFFTQLSFNILASRASFTVLSFFAVNTTGDTNSLLRFFPVSRDVRIYLIGLIHFSRLVVGGMVLVWLSVGLGSILVLFGFSLACF